MGIDGIAEMAMRREEAKWMNAVNGFLINFTPDSEIKKYMPTYGVLFFKLYVEFYLYLEA